MKKYREKLVHLGAGLVLTGALSVIGIAVANAAEINAPVGNAVYQPNVAQQHFGIQKAWYYRYHYRYWYGPRYHYYRYHYYYWHRPYHYRYYWRRYY